MHACVAADTDVHSIAYNTSRNNNNSNNVVGKRPALASNQIAPHTMVDIKV